MAAPFGMTPLQLLAAAHIAVVLLSLSLFVVWAAGDWWLGRRS